jgi:hypothetical protein
MICNVALCNSLRNRRDSTGQGIDFRRHGPKISILEELPSGIYYPVMRRYGWRERLLEIWRLKLLPLFDWGTVLPMLELQPPAHLRWKIFA